MFYNCVVKDVSINDKTRFLIDKGIPELDILTAQQIYENNLKKGKQDPSSQVKKQNNLSYSDELKRQTKRKNILQ